MYEIIINTELELEDLKEKHDDILYMGKSVYHPGYDWYTIGDDCSVYLQNQKDTWEEVLRLINREG